ncbi:MAG: transferrin-binding protein-like solute binding protein, partial [Pseudomonadota bacterium]
YDTGDTSINAPKSFKVSKNASGELTAIFDGVEYAFKPSDRVVESNGESYGYELRDANGDYVAGMFSYTGELDEVMDTRSDDYVAILNLQRRLENGVNDNAFGVFGSEAPEDVFAGGGQASYDTFMRINLVPTTGFQSNTESRRGLRGDGTFDVDFAAGTVGGSISNLTLQEPQSSVRTPGAGSVEFATTTLTSDGFSGTVAGDAGANALVGGTLTGTYEGGLFGPNGEQIAGATSVSTAGATEQVGSGYFEGRID